MRIIMTALAPLECRHPRLGQSLWRLGVMRPQCLHAHAAPAGVLVCPAGRPGEVSLPSVASSPCASGGADSGRRAPLVRAPPPPPPPPTSPACVCVCVCVWLLCTISEGKGRLKSWTLCNRLSEEIMGKGLAAPPPPPPRPLPTPSVVARCTICEG